MNDAHLHLIVNHLPILGSLFGALVLAWGILKNNRPIIAVALVTFVVLGAVSFIAHTTGEGAEEVVEHSGIQYDHGMIEEHEEAAFPAHLAMVFTAMTALVALLVKKLKDNRIVPIVVLILSIITFGLMARAGNLGGKITHSEIRSTGDLPSLPDDDDD